MLQQLGDAPDITAPLDPPTLTMPAPGAAPDKTPAKAVETTSPRQKVIPLVLCVVAIVGAAVLVAKTQARQRQ